MGKQCIYHIPATLQHLQNAASGLGIHGALEVVLCSRNFILALCTSRQSCEYLPGRRIIWKRIRESIHCWKFCQWFQESGSMCLQYQHLQVTWVSGCRETQSKASVEAPKEPQPGISCDQANINLVIAIDIISPLPTFYEKRHKLPVQESSSC